MSLIDSPPPEDLGRDWFGCVAGGEGGDAWTIGAGSSSTTPKTASAPTTSAIATAPPKNMTSERIALA
jgi:hypothetical protein